MNSKTVSGNYTVLSTDQILLCDTSGGAVNLTLPKISGDVNTGSKLTIVDSGNNAGVNLITATANASDNINGRANIQVCVNGGVLTLSPVSSTKWSAEGNKSENIYYLDSTALGTDNDTLLKVLGTYTLPANFLKNVGDGVEIEIRASLDAGGHNNDTISFRVGGSTILTLSIAYPGEVVVGKITIVKTASNAQHWWGHLSSVSLKTQPGAGTLAITDTAAIVLDITGQNFAALADAVVLRTFQVKSFKA